jgi:small subunit ribosomal protein S18
MSESDQIQEQQAETQEGGEAPRRFAAGAQAERPARDARARRPAAGGRFGGRRKVCVFCADNIDEVDYKDVARLRRHLSERAKIEPRRKMGTCAKHQRSLTVAIKRARHVALLPFVAGTGRS